jgi:hypothetical protein
MGGQCPPFFMKTLGNHRPKWLSAIIGIAGIAGFMYEFF